MKFTDESKIGALTLFCLLLIGVLFTNVIHKPIDLLAAMMPFYFFFVFLLDSRSGQERRRQQPGLEYNYYDSYFFSDNDLCHKIKFD